MRRLSAVLIVCATLSATGLANAGACTEQIKQLRQAAHVTASEMTSQTSHTFIRIIVDADLEVAEAKDAEGNEAECQLAVRRATLDQAGDQ